MIILLTKKFELGEIEALPNGFDPGPDEKTAAASLTNILSNTFGVLTLVGAVMFIIYFVLGALNIITSQGDQEKLKKAQKQMTNAVLGLLIVIASYGLTYIIGTVLGIDILSPADYIVNFLKPGGQTQTYQEGLIDF